MYDKKSCGERLKKIRTFKSKTQKQVSNEIGVSVDTLRKLEQGKRAPSVGVVDLLANYYGVTADYIISGIERNNEYNEKLSVVSKEKRAKVEEVIDGILELVK